MGNISEFLKRLFQWLLQRQKAVKEDRAFISMTRMELLQRRMQNLRGRLFSVAKSREINMNLPSVDDLFTTQEERNQKNQEYVKDISIYEITDFPNHPFKVKMDDKEVTNDYEFTADKENMEVQIEFTFDGDTLGGKRLCNL